MSNDLRKARAQKKAEQAQAPRENPEINARIDQWIAEHPEAYQKMMDTPLERLCRQKVLGILNAEEQNQKRQQYRAEKVEAWLEENPKAKASIEARIANIQDPEKKQAAFNSLTNRAMADQALRGVKAPSMAQTV